MLTSEVDYEVFGLSPSLSFPDWTWVVSCDVPFLSQQATHIRSPPPVNLTFSVFLHSSHALLDPQFEPGPPNGRMMTACGLWQSLGYQQDTSKVAGRNVMMMWTIIWASRKHPKKKVSLKHIGEKLTRHKFVLLFYARLASLLCIIGDLFALKIIYFS